MTANDLDLLRKFNRDQSQDAFAALVRRHLDLVYCAALRQVRSHQLAEEVAQSWLSATKEAKFDTDADVRKTLSRLRRLAKNRVPMGRALNEFIRSNNGQLPAELSQLKPYIQSAFGDAPLAEATLDAILQRYTLLHTGNVSDSPQGTWIVVEKAPVDKDYDSRAKFGNGTSTIIGTGLHSAGDPDDQTY